VLHETDEEEWAQEAMKRHLVPHNPLKWSRNRDNENQATRQLELRRPIKGDVFADFLGEVAILAALLKYGTSAIWKTLLVGITASQLCTFCLSPIFIMTSNWFFATS
jgi:hypothetical protein